MITDSESSTVWQSNGNIGKDGEYSVGKRRLESQIVGDFMNRKEQVLVRRGTDNVGSKQEGNGYYRCVP